MSQVFATALWLAVLSGPAPPVDPGSLRLAVLLVNDPDFPPVTRPAAEAILTAARATLADKLTFADLTFDIVGEIPVSEFLSESRRTPACLEQLEPHRVWPFGRLPRDVPKEAVLRFLGRWQVDALRAFFPEELRVNLNSYDDIYSALMDEFTRKLQLIASFRLPNGTSLLRPEAMAQRSYVHWICAVRNQDRADLVLTNAFILYDLGSEPYPHSVFAKNKVGGASLHSDKRTAIGSRAVIGSTFSMDTSLDFFREEGIETLTADERHAVIGTFIIAHEMGHAVFKIPDFYDHPRECLMTTKYETGYVSGYRTIRQFPGACAQCQPYVVAKRHVFRAEASAQRQAYAEAIDQLKDAIRTTPKHIDGSYLRYVASLSVRVAELYLSMGDRAQADRWLKSALRIVPDHEQALALQQRIDRSG